MCAWCAPTPRVVVAVLPPTSFGGALFVAEPWQEMHVVATSRTPSTWWVGDENVVGAPTVTSLWHWPQSGFCGCGAGGGLPWHAVQARCVPSTVVHTGAVFVPP